MKNNNQAQSSNWKLPWSVIIVVAVIFLLMVVSRLFIGQCDNVRSSDSSMLNDAKIEEVSNETLLKSPISTESISIPEEAFSSKYDLKLLELAISQEVILSDSLEQHSTPLQSSFEFTHNNPEEDIIVDCAVDSIASTPEQRYNTTVDHHFLALTEKHGLTGQSVVRLIHYTPTADMKDQTDARLIRTLFSPAEFSTFKPFKDAWKFKPEHSVSNTIYQWSFSKIIRNIFFSKKS